MMKFTDQLVGTGFSIYQFMECDIGGDWWGSAIVG
jgi:hypothetical protein